MTQAWSIRDLGKQVPMPPRRNAESDCGHLPWLRSRSPGVDIAIVLESRMVVRMLEMTISSCLMLERLRHGVHRWATPAACVSHGGAGSPSWTHLPGNAGCKLDQLTLLTDEGRSCNLR